MIEQYNNITNVNWSLPSRGYDPGIGRFTGVDPKSTQYSSICPYSYVANNPIVFVDLDGMEIGDGKDAFNSFRSEVKGRINQFRNRAKRLKSKAAKALAAGKEGKADRLNKRANRASESADNYGGILTELNSLEESDQLYNIYTSSSEVGEGAGGNIQYDVGSEAVNINIKDSYNDGALAHELKHAFQFEIGALSFGTSGKVGGSLYDLQDEAEAYVRGSMFGYPINPSMSELKTEYSSISSRTSQLNLSTPGAAFPGAATLGDQLMARTNQAYKKGDPPPEYFKDWKRHYDN